VLTNGESRKLSNQTLPTIQPKAPNTTRNILLAVLVVAIVIVSFMALWLAVLNSGSSGGEKGIIPTSHTLNLVNGLLTINPHAYYYTTFTVPNGASNVQVYGTFTASGGSGNDIIVYVMDDTNFVNWQNGHSASTYYNSGQVTTGTISAILPSGGTYCLVYDNSFSIISQKNVNTQVNLGYTY
jgi:hypothetical protein